MANDGVGRTTRKQRFQYQQYCGCWLCLIGRSKKRVLRDAERRKELVALRKGSTDAMRGPGR